MRKSSFIIFLLVASLGSSAVAFARGGGGGGGMGGYGQGNQGMANPGGEVQERNKIMEQNRTNSQVQQPSGSQSKPKTQEQTRDQVRQQVETQQQ